MKKLIVVLALLILHVGAVTGAAFASLISQLDITGGSVALSIGQAQFGPHSFSTEGTLLMGQFQPPPHIIDPVKLPLGHQIQFVTDGMQGKFPPPSASVNGNTINVDLNSLFLKLSGPLVKKSTGGNKAFLHIGNNASGTFDPTTGAFEISWLKIYKEKNPWLAGAEFTVEGTTSSPPAVPLPGALLLFGTGLLGLPLLKKRGEKKDR